MELLIYLMKMLAYAAIFAGIYQLMLVRLPLHAFNRRYLLGAIILPYLLPLLSFAFLPEMLNAIAVINLPEVVAGAGARMAEQDSAGWLQQIAGSYVAVTACLLLRLAAQHARLMLKLRRARTVSCNGARIAITPGLGPGSYQRHIFFPDEQIDPLMLAHEQAHIGHRHYLDLWMIQLAKAFLWFIPFTCYFAAKLKMVHEYEADAAAEGDSPVAYAQCLLAHTLGTRQPLVSHSFFHHPIKNRIMMLQKNRTRAYFRYARLLAFLLAGALSTTGIVAQTARNKPGSKSGKEAIFKKVDQMAEFDGDVNLWLSNHLTYPENARKKGQEGRVVVRFVIDERGKVTGSEAVRSSNVAALDAEAIRVVGEMPAWKPARNKGKNVKVYYHLPVTFRLES